MFHMSKQAGKPKIPKWSSKIPELLPWLAHYITQQKSITVRWIKRKHQKAAGHMWSWRWFNAPEYVGGNFHHAPVQKCTLEPWCSQEPFSLCLKTSSQLSVGAGLNRHLSGTSIYTCIILIWREVFYIRLGDFSTSGFLLFSPFSLDAWWIRSNIVLTAKRMWSRLLQFTSKWVFMELESYWGRTGWAFTCLSAAWGLTWSCWIQYWLVSTSTWTLSTLFVLSSFSTVRKRRGSVLEKQKQNRKQAIWSPFRLQLPGGWSHFLCSVPSFSNSGSRPPNYGCPSVKGHTSQKAKRGLFVRSVLTDR